MINTLDRIGLVFVGIFLGGVLEATGFENLSIIVSVVALIIVFTLDLTFLKEKKLHKSHLKRKI